MKRQIIFWWTLSILLPARLLARLLQIPKKGGHDEALLLFTSGSSGEPKGVVLSHRNIAGNVSRGAGKGAGAWRPLSDRRRGAQGFGSNAVDVHSSGEAIVDAAVIPQQGPTTASRSITVKRTSGPPVAGTLITIDVNRIVVQVRDSSVTT